MKTKTSIRSAKKKLGLELRFRTQEKLDLAKAAFQVLDRAELLPSASYYWTSTYPLSLFLYDSRMKPLRAARKVKP